MSVVVDASAALAWILQSQATSSGQAFLHTLDQRRCFSPSIFTWEIRNVLLGLDRRGLLAAIDYETALQALSELQIEVAPPHSAQQLGELAIFAREVRLSLFDAAYLAMAVERSFGLVSRDARLLQIARSSGVECFDLTLGAQA